MYLVTRTCKLYPLSDHDKLIVTEQDVDQVLARPGRRVCRRRNLARGAAPEGGQLRRVAEQFRLLREESLGLVALPGRRGAPQYGLEGRVNEGRGRRLLSELSRQGPRHPARELRIRERESLLRDDAFGALVAVARVGHVKELQEEHLGVG